MTELMKILEDNKGLISLVGNRPADWEARIVETINLIQNKSKLPSHKHEFLVKEAMTTSDFPLLFGDILDRSVLAAYQSAPQVMGQVVAKETRTDFRLNNMFDVQLGTGRMSSRNEKNEFHITNVAEGHYQYALGEYGEKLMLTWRVLVNDNLGVFTRIPKWFATIAANTEEYNLTNLFFSATGPRAAYFSVANGGAAVSTLPLTLANLKTAIQAMVSYQNASGDAPIDNSPLFLMTGPGNWINALEITGTKTEQRTGGAAVAYPVDSVIGRFNLRVLMNPWIPFITTTGTIASTTWALFSDPNKIAAGVEGKLRGHENPDIFIKKSDLQQLGGGDVSPTEGDWDTSSVGYLVRHCMGGCTLNGRAGWASNGQ